MPAELRRLLRGMNWYYTNRIEGQHTRPLEIEQALRQDFSSNRELAARQRLAVAHIYAELAFERRPRRGDLDGRGNLSQQALVAWIDHVLDLCLDQVQFMAGLLKLQDIERRIAACLVFEEKSLKSGLRLVALRALHYLFVTGGALGSGDFKAMLALGERTAGTVLKALLDRGLLSTDSPQGPVRFGLPLHALRFYFPGLWPEAEADAAGASS